MKIKCGSVTANKTPRTIAPSIQSRVKNAQCPSEEPLFWWKSFGHCYAYRARKMKSLLKNTRWKALRFDWAEIGNFAAAAEEKRRASEEQMTCPGKRRFAIRDSQEASMRITQTEEWKTKMNVKQKRDRLTFWHGRFWMRNATMAINTSQISRRQILRLSTQFHVTPSFFHLFPRFILCQKIAFGCGFSALGREKKKKEKTPRQHSRDIVSNAEENNGWKRAPYRIFQARKRSVYLVFISYLIIKTRASSWQVTHYCVPFSRARMNYAVRGGINRGKKVAIRLVAQKLNQDGVCKISGKFVIIVGS